MSIREPNQRVTVFRLFRQEFGVVNDNTRLVGHKNGGNQNGNVHIAWDEKKNYGTRKTDINSDYNEVAFTILHELTHFMHDSISDYNYFFFKHTDTDNGPAMSRAEMGTLAMSKDFNALRIKFGRSTTYKFFARGKAKVLEMEPGKKYPKTSSGILGKGCQIVPFKGVTTSSALYLVNADSYASFALAMHRGP